MMNKFEAKMDKSEYGIDPYFLNICIDGIWLDELLGKFKQEAKGCIPTLSLGMEDKREEIIVWERFLPREGSISYCPILMCPDDNDFYCTCIVAEIQDTEDKIIWSRIGADGSDVREAKNVGSEVSWFPDFEKLEFKKEDYLKVINAFISQYQLDREEFEERKIIS